jgi:lipoyl(octanoyl) transferase
VRGLEQAIIDSLAEFGIGAGRDPGRTGVWVGGRKIAAIGVHISRWVTSHGFALNHTTDLSYFQYIVPCGLTLPVTSIENEGAAPDRARVIESLAKHFAAHFDLELMPERETEKAI